MQLLWRFHWVHLLMGTCQAVGRTLKLPIQLVQLLEDSCVGDASSEVQHHRNCGRQEVQAGHNEESLPAEWRAETVARSRPTVPDAAGWLHST